MKKSSKKSGRGPRDLGISHPPQINPQVVHRQRMRFTCTTAATALAISFRNLLDAILIATSATVGYDVFDQVRVNLVEVWAIPATAAATTVAVQYSGGVAGFSGDGRVYSDTSLGVQPAHVRCRPSAMSAAALWQVSANATPAFALTCPVGSVVDVDLSFRTVATDAPTAAANALVGATVGEMYYRGLDGVATATTTLPAVAPTVI